MWKIISVYSFLIYLSFIEMINLNRYLLYGLKIDEKKREENTAEVQTTSGY